MTSEPTISVVEVLTGAGFTYSKRLAWAAGRAVAKEWRREHDAPPAYAMKPKTLGSTGGGPAHLKAVYPESWRERIVRIVAKHADAPPEPEQSPEARPTMAQAVAVAAWAREALTGSIQRLTWDVDLIADVGEPDAIGDPDGYCDQRWTAALGRLQSAIRSMQGDECAVTELVLIVACLWGKADTSAPVPRLIELPLPPIIDIAIAQRPPPYGRWRLMTDPEIRQRVPGWYKTPIGIPSSYFIDGVPF